MARKSKQSANQRRIALELFRDICTMNDERDCYDVAVLALEGNAKAIEACEQWIEDARRANARK